MKMNQMKQKSKTRSKAKQSNARKFHESNHSKAIQKDPYFIPFEKIEIWKGLQKGLSIVLRTGVPIQKLKTDADLRVAKKECDNQQKDSVNYPDYHKEELDISEQSTVDNTDYHKEGKTSGEITIDTTETANSDTKLSVQKKNEINKDDIILQASNGGLVVANTGDITSIINEFNIRGLRYHIYLRIDLSKTSDYIIVLFPGSVSGSKILEACKRKNMLGDAFIIEKFGCQALLYRIDHNSPDYGILRSGINYRCCRLGAHALFNDSITIELSMSPSDILRSYNKFCNNQVDFLPESLYPVNASPLVVDNLLSSASSLRSLNEFGEYHNIDQSILLLSEEIFRSNHSSFVTLIQNSEGYY